jgi:CPA2 family monovalent cation:H+ antiporter-2
LTQSVQLTKIVTQTIQHDQHVIICGFGITGQHVANLLEQEGIRYVALDADPDRVQEASDAGKSVVYGAYGVKGLIAAGIARAKVVVIAFNHIEESAYLIKQIEELHPGIAIIVRASDDSDMELLQKAGATQVIPEKIEGGLMLAAHTLSVLGVPIRRVMRRITEARENRYGKLKGHFPSAEEDDGDSPESIRLHTIRLGPNMRGINQTLSFIEQTGAVVQSLRRKENKMAATFKQIILEPNVVIQEDDILVLLGNMASLEAAEKLITKPSKNL